MDLKEIAMDIVEHAIRSVLPDRAVKEELERRNIENDVILIAIGKAAWRMAKAAHEVLGSKIKKGIVITKYGHSEGPIDDFEIYEAGHPIPDENTVKASERVLDVVEDLRESDLVLFLVSGGGSSLFEVPQDGITLEDIKCITDELLKSGANIVEINAIRKRLSKVKGGRFALLCKPARILALVLSDVLGDRLDSIASGPAYPDMTTSEFALDVVERHGLKLPERIIEVLKKETPKEIDNAEHVIIGSLKKACEAAAERAKELGLDPHVITTLLDCEAKEAGRFIGSIAKEIRSEGRPFKPPVALIFGGETVVHVKGKGKGGRNQELALSAAISIRGFDDVVVLSIGTDGTDGPTDAAGGIVDGKSYELMKKKGLNPGRMLDENDSYNALSAIGALVKTGPTGTNVNDLILLLVQ